MNLTFDKIDDTKARLTVDVVENDYASTVKKELRRVGETHALPGFRKGHVPFGILEKRFGKDVTSDVINQEVYKAVGKYLEENKINVLGAPVPTEVVALDLDNKKDYTFSYDLALAPELDITLDKSIEIPYYKIAVSDEMIAEQDKALTRRFGTQGPGEEFEDDALVKGALMQLDAEGNVMEGADAVQVAEGIVAPMYFKSADETAKFKGCKVGDKVKFNPWNTCNGDPTELTSMLHIDKEKAAEMKSDFIMEVSEIIVVRPAEHNEEFFTNVFGKDRVHNEEEYREGVKAMISQQLAGNSENIFRDEVYNYMTKKYGDFALAEDVLTKWLISYDKEFTAENADERFKAMLPGLKWQLIRDNIAAKMETKVTEEDLKAYAVMMARRQFAQYGMSNLTDDVYEDFGKRMLEDKKTRNRIVEEVREHAFFNDIKNRINVPVKEVSIDEFRDMVSKMNAEAGE